MVQPALMPEKSEVHTRASVEDMTALNGPVEPEYCVPAMVTWS